MPAAKVRQAAYVEHPESGDDLLRLTLDAPYAVGGVTAPWTDIWVERAAPPPLYDTLVEWDHRHASWDGKRWRKFENDSLPNDPLH